MTFRWWLFKSLSRVGWVICPEPHRTFLAKYYRIDWEKARHDLKSIDEKLEGLKRL